MKPIDYGSIFKIHKDYFDTLLLHYCLLDHEEASDSENFKVCCTLFENGDISPTFKQILDGFQWTREYKDLRPFQRFVPIFRAVSP